VSDVGFGGMVMNKVSPRDPARSMAVAVGLVRHGWID